jgi:hypothetical protein
LRPNNKWATAILFFCLAPLLNSFGGLIWIGVVRVLPVASCIILGIIEVMATAATIWVLCNNPND